MFVHANMNTHMVVCIHQFNCMLILVRILFLCIQPHSSLLINRIKKNFQKYKSDCYCNG